jgi:uncharacterized damage-inducible protein DinB
MMTSREFYLRRLKTEFPVTLQVLQALPKDQLSYKPDKRSPSAEQLAWTLTFELKACLGVVNESKAKWETLPPPPIAEMLRDFEQAANALADRVSKIDDEAWERTAGFYYEGKLVSEQPAGSFLWLSLFDSIHHRGQLTAYLRPMGGKVPAVYGPSADDNGHGAWQ